MMDRQIAATEWDFKFRKSPPSDQHLGSTKMAFGFRELQRTDLAFFHDTKPHFKAFGADPRAPPGAEKLADVITRRRRRHHRRRRRRLGGERGMAGGMAGSKGQ